MDRKENNRFFEILSKNDMTQKELSRITGITESSISHYVKGDRVPRGINLLKMSKALNVTSDYLLGDDCEQAADVAPVVLGRWGIKHINHFSYYVCSNCGFNGLVCKKYNTYNYCPYCGAKMDLEV